MSTWRARALEMFPDMRSQIQSAESVGYFWVDLIWRLKANYAQDEPKEPPSVVRAICLYAVWCAGSESQATREAACIEFYEYLPKFALECPATGYKRLIRDVLANFGLAEIEQMGVSLDAADLKRFLADARQAEEERRRSRG